MVWIFSHPVRSLPPSEGQEGFDRRDRFAAYLNTLRWNTVTSTDPDLFQSPFRAGIGIKASPRSLTRLLRRTHIDGLLPRNRPPKHPISGTFRSVLDPGFRRGDGGEVSHQSHGRSP